jgi:hypothetical protein
MEVRKFFLLHCVHKKGDAQWCQKRLLSSSHALILIEDFRSYSRLDRIALLDCLVYYLLPI